MSTEIHRCSWANGDPLMVAYHDEEWGIPIHDSRELWEMLNLEAFQAGLSWITVLRKRETLRAAYKNFVPEVIAEFSADDIERLLQDPGIIRSRAKIEATIGNAKAYLKMREEGEDFSEFVWGLAGGRTVKNQTGQIPAQNETSEKISKELKKRGFKFVGPTIVYAWMQAVGMMDDHLPGCFRYQDGA